MFLLSDTAKLLVLAFMVTTMLSIGLQTGLAELRSVLASRRLVARALVANFVVVPLLGLALARFLPLTREAAGALILLACVPGGLSAIQYARKVKGEAARAGALLVLLNVLAMVVSPVILRVVLPAGEGFSLPYGRILGFIVLTAVIPLGVGVFLQDKAPGMAPRLSKGLGLVSLLLYVAFMVVTKAFRKEAMVSIGGPAVGILALFLIASMAIGWFMGGPTRETRQLMATLTGTRNAALCLAIARHMPSGGALITPLVAVIVLMGPPNALLAVYSAIRARRAAKRTAKSGEGKES